jgi:hypothetical protein
MRVVTSKFEVWHNRGLHRCPLCAGCGFGPFRFGLVRCATCGLVVNPAIFSAGSGDALNQEAFGDAWDPETSFWVRWFQAWKNRRYLANLRRAGATRGRLLEVGVGSGSFLRAAREAGFCARKGSGSSPAAWIRVERGYG